jgi:hypothetical protein
MLFVVSIHLVRRSVAVETDPHVLQPADYRTPAPPFA